MVKIDPVGDAAAAAPAGMAATIPVPRSRDGLAALPALLRGDGEPVVWRIADHIVAYADAVAAMEARVAAIADGTARELIWLVEHPPLYTAGTSANPADLLQPDRFPVHATGRGGEFTYHGPGQRVIYVLLDLKQRGQDVRRFVAALESWIIAALWDFGIRGLRREDRVGVWVVRPDRPEIAPGQPAEDKIAAIGIRLRRWVSFHGASLNVEPDLDHFSGIVPCGIAGYGVTSLVDLGLPVSMDDVDGVLRRTFEPIFGPTVDREA
jgi:lipoyl(octanoyl) transferase